MGNKHSTYWGKIAKQLRSKFIIGILVIAPIGATIWILIWVFNGLDNILEPVIKSIWGRSFPGVGFGAIIVLIYLAGILASNFVGKGMIKWGESILERIPLVRQLYNGIKQIMESFLAPGESRYMEVILIEFPRKGMWSIGFVTNKLSGKSGEKLLSIFIPTSPNPTSGFLQITSEEEIIRTNISVDEALKMVVSAGRAASGMGKKFAVIG